MAVQQIATSISDTNLRSRIASHISVAMLAAILTIVPIARAQTFTVIHDFTGADGVFPEGALVMDRAEDISWHNPREQRLQAVLPRRLAFKPVIPIPSWRRWLGPALWRRVWPQWNSFRHHLEWWGTRLHARLRDHLQSAPVADGSKIGPRSLDRNTTSSVPRPTRRTESNIRRIGIRRQWRGLRHHGIRRNSVAVVR